LLPSAGLPASVRVDRRAFGLDGGRYFALVVTGEGMAEAGIRDGDTVILRGQDAVKDGDIVAAAVNGRAMLRRLYRERDRVRLQPASKSRKPTYARSVTVLGVVKGIMRRIG
jgi:repressor LexA